MTHLSHARKRANLNVLWILPFKEYLLKPLSDCSTFTFGHFVILCGGVTLNKRRKKKEKEQKEKKARNRQINEQCDVGTKEQGS